MRGTDTADGHVISVKGDPLGVCRGERGVKKRKRGTEEKRGRKKRQREKDGAERVMKKRKTSEEQEKKIQSWSKWVVNVGIVGRAGGGECRMLVT